MKKIYKMISLPSPGYNWNSPLVMRTQLGKRVVLGIASKADKGDWAFFAVFWGQTAMMNCSNFVYGFWGVAISHQVGWIELDGKITWDMLDSCFYGTFDIYCTVVVLGVVCSQNWNIVTVQLRRGLADSESVKVVLYFTCPIYDSQLSNANQISIFLFLY